MSFYTGNNSSIKKLKQIGEHVYHSLFALYTSLFDLFAHKHEDRKCKFFSAIHYWRYHVLVGQSANPVLN